MHEYQQAIQRVNDFIDDKIKELTTSLDNRIISLRHYINLEERRICRKRGINHCLFVPCFPKDFFAEEEYLRSRSKIRI